MTQELRGIFIEPIPLLYNEPATRRERTFRHATRALNTGYEPKPNHFHNMSPKHGYNSSEDEEQPEHHKKVISSTMPEKPARKKRRVLPWETSKVESGVGLPYRFVVASSSPTPSGRRQVTEEETDSETQSDNEDTNSSSDLKLEASQQERLGSWGASAQPSAPDRTRATTPHGSMRVAYETPVKKQGHAISPPPLRRKYNSSNLHLGYVPVAQPQFIVQPPASSHPGGAASAVVPAPSAGTASPAPVNIAPRPLNGFGPSLGEIASKAKGTSFYTNSRTWAQEVLVVVRERGNPHDYWALGLRNTYGDSVGYITADIAAILSPHVDSGAIRVDAHTQGKTGQKWNSYRSAISIMVYPRDGLDISKSLLEKQGITFAN